MNEERLECGHACKGAYTLFASQRERERERERERKRERKRVRERN
jgi:hypothetical protein